MFETYVRFPVPVKTDVLGRSYEQNAELIDYFLSLKARGEGASPLPNQGWKTDWDTHADPILNELLTDVYNWYIRNVAQPRNHRDYPEIMHDSLDLEVDANVWFQESLPGEECPVHDHGAVSKISWVYYLDVGDNPSPLTFPIIDTNFNIVDEIHLPVYNDYIVMFPSLLPHLVYPSKSNRYIVAGNINDIRYKDVE